MPALRVTWHRQNVGSPWFKTSDGIDRIRPFDGMNDVANYLRLPFTTAPWYYLSWPAVAMVMGTFLGIVFAAFAAQLAVVPRQARGLVGIISAPFVHVNVAHFAANLPPFLVLGTLMLRRDAEKFPEIALTLAGVQGLLLWLGGRKAAHVGMSGVIFSFFGYLLAVAWFTQTTPDLIAAGVVLLFYGGMLWGVAPTRNGTSWEGHLFGLVTGIGLAWFRYRQ